MTDKKPNIYESLIKKFGVISQFMKFIEEITELTRAIIEKDRMKILEELVDVEVLITQFYLIKEGLKKKYDIQEPELFEYKKRKLEKIARIYLK